MDITFLYFEDCPSHDTALNRLKSILAEEGIEAPIEVIKVETDEAAQTHQFVGSPTIRLNGEDMVPPEPDAMYGLMCRAYRREDGRISPLPTHETIRHAIRAKLKHT